MTEKIRRIHDPTVEPDGSQVVHSIATPESFDMRAGTTIGSNKVIPVIFIPGIMGTNLRVRRGTKLPNGLDLKPGEPAWRPPNDPYEALLESRKWKNRTAAQRQEILNADLLEVDDKGALDVAACGLSHEVMRERGWGEIYTGVYGALLFDLQSHLDKTFRLNALKQREVRSYWKQVMQCSPSRWGERSIEHVTEAELEIYAGYQYPVYGVGYNWLQSCAVSAERVVKRIAEIRNFWRARKHECDKVILITHSMGGLVARAAAKKVPEMIAGVIHGAMPALGAPIAYRRLACGTEKTGATEEFGADTKAEIFAEIAGQTAEETTPVMAVSPGVLQLLPTHLYPKPWLFARTVSEVNKKRNYQDVLGLPQGDPYEMYRDMESWYRLIDPTLIDPAHRYQYSPRGAVDVATAAIDEAERFHKEVLFTVVAKGGKEIKEPYYHENTYAFYGADTARRSYSRICWAAPRTPGQGMVLTAGNLMGATAIGHASDGSRTVEVEGRYRLRFGLEAQDAAGDDTVPSQSGAAPEGKIRKIFATRGYSHQGSYEHRDMLLLTRHLIVKIVVQGLT